MCYVKNALWQLFLFAFPLFVMNLSIFVYIIGHLFFSSCLSGIYFQWVEQWKGSDKELSSCVWAAHQGPAAQGSDSNTSCDIYTVVKSCMHTWENAVSILNPPGREDGYQVHWHSYFSATLSTLPLCNLWHVPANFFYFVPPQNSEKPGEGDRSGILCS